MHSVADIAKLRDLIRFRVESYCEYNPIDLPGITIQVDSVNILTPRELRAHERALSDERWVRK